MGWVHLVLTVFASSAFAEPESYRGYTLISADLQNQGQVILMNRLADVYQNQLDFFTHPSTKQLTDILVPPGLKNEIHNILITNGIPYTDRVSDYQTLIEEERKSVVTHGQISRSRQAAGQYITDNYLDFEGIMGFLYEEVALHPDVMSMETLGQTYEGRDLNMVKLSRNDGKDRPAIIMESLTHAREWITGAVMINFIKALAENVDNEAKDMLDWFDWYIVPVHNPDGYAYSHSRSNRRLWRKNRNYFSNLNCYGVDLNRNWGYFHGVQGTSSYCGSETFSDSEFSQSETKHFKSKMEKLSNVQGFISLHSYSQVLLVPMAYSGRKPDDYGFSDSLLRSVAYNATDALKSVFGTTFEVGTPLETIRYGASGGAYDYAMAVLKIPFSYTYELRDKGSNGFVLPASEIFPSFLETYVSLYSLAKDIHNYYQSTIGM